MPGESGFLSGEYRTGRAMQKLQSCRSRCRFQWVGGWRIGCMLLDDTEQVIAKPRKQVVSGKYRKAQIVCHPKSNSDQNRIQDDHGNTLEDAPLATMRAPLGDGFCNRACSSAWS